MGEPARRRAVRATRWALGAAVALGLGAVARGRGRAARFGKDGVAATDADLLDVLVHELRTPVVSIGSLTRALERDGALDAEARREALNLVQLHTAHLTAMLEDIRDFSARVRDSVSTAETLRLGAQPHRRRAIDLDDLVAASAAASGLPVARLRVERAPGVPPVVGDPVGLQRILTNLLENAHRHGDPDGPVDVAWQAADDRLLLTVTSPTAKRPAPHADGHGLGGPIVSSLAASLGGRVERTDGEGVYRVVVELPTTPAPPHG